MSPCPTCRAETPDGARFCPACGTRLEAERREATERKVVSTLFADLVGFTALGERHDPEDVDAALRGYYALARTIIERFGGVVEKFIGDAVVGLFGVPLAHEDDAERAVRAALEIVAHMHELPPIGDGRLQVHAAVNTGPALVRLNARAETGDGVLVGDAVNTCARLLAETPAMGVVVGELTQRLSSRVIAYEPMAPRAAKGKEKPVERWLARGLIAHRGTTPSPASAPMIGREVELAVLLGLLDRAVASRTPQYALIEGEAGIGKTRLVREMFRVVDERPNFFCTWRQGRCPAYGDSLAFWALGEMVAGHAGILQSDAPEVAEHKLREALGSRPHDEWMMERLRPLVGLPTVQVDREDSFSAWRQFFEELAQVRPTVLVLEDLHWASESTLAFLQDLMTHTVEVPLVVIGTARPEVRIERPAFAEASAWTTIPLAALSAEESARMASAVLGADSSAATVDLAVSRGGGNPLFTEELVRFMHERGRKPSTPSDTPASNESVIPDTLRSLIAARLDAMPSECRAVVSNAAVVGETFWPTVVDKLDEEARSGLPRILDELCDREVIRRHASSSIEGEDEYGFWHAMIRDVAYERLPRHSRAMKHATMASWLEGRSRRQENLVDVVAYHYAVALDLAQAVQDAILLEHLAEPACTAFRRAGDSAMRLNVATARVHYDRALELAQSGSTAHASLLTKRGEGLKAVGERTAATEDFRAAIAEYRALGDGLGQALATSRLSHVVSDTDVRAGAELARSAVDVLPPTASGTEAVEVLENWAIHSLYLNDLPRVLETTTRIVSLTTSHTAISLHGYVRCLMGDWQGLKDMESAAAEAEADYSSRDVAGLRDAYARMLCLTDHPQAVISLLEVWTTEAEQRRDARSAALLRRFAATVLLLAGRPQQAIEEAVASHEALAPTPGSMEDAELATIRGLALLMQGQDQVAEDDIVHFEKIRGGLPEPWMLGQTAAAVLCTRKGQREQARAMLRELLRSYRLSIDPVGILWWPLAARTSLAADDVEAAKMLARQAADWPACPKRVIAALKAAVAEADGDLESAATGFGRAAVLWQAVMAPYETGHARLGEARCLSRLGLDVDAERALSHAEALFAEVGAAADGRTAEQLRQVIRQAPSPQGSSSARRSRPGRSRP